MMNYEPCASSREVERFLGAPRLIDPNVQKVNVAKLASGAVRGI
jgi:hypothetical protein